MKRDNTIRAFFLIVLAGIVFTGTAAAEEDPFKGRLFPPNVILEHRGALDLSKTQLTGIRAAVVDVQSKIAEYEWDMQQAYLALIEALDERPIDEETVLEHASVALEAENEVKKRQILMLVRLKNLLTGEQIAHLESVTAE